MHSNKKVGINMLVKFYGQTRVDGRGVKLRVKLHREDVDMLTRGMQSICGPRLLKNMKLY
jgi:hypothetical protein